MTTDSTTSTTTRLPADDSQPKHTRHAHDEHSGTEKTTTNTPPSAKPASDAGGRSVSVWTMLTFIAGCVILVVAAINLPNLSRWGDEHGNVTVFLCFFLVMSIGGRWFWGGIDALWSAARGKGN